MIAWLLLAACRYDRDAPEPVEPLSFDARTGTLLYDEVAWPGFGVRLGRAPGGLLVALDLLDGFTPLEDDTVARPGETRWAWLPDDGDALEPLEGPASSSARYDDLGVSLVPGGAVALLQADSAPYAAWIHDGATWERRDLPGLVAPDDTSHALLPDGRVFVVDDGVPTVCGATCEPAWGGVDGALQAWGPDGPILAWLDGERVCAGTVGPAGPEGTPACGPLHPSTGNAPFVYPAPWQDPDALQVAVDLGRNIVGAQIYALEDGVLVPGDRLPFQEIAVAPLAPRLHLVEHLPEEAPSYYFVPKWHTVERGRYVATDLEDFVPRLTCGCDRETDPTCDCLPRLATMQVFPTTAGTHARFLTTDRVDGHEQLTGGRFALPQQVEPWRDETCELTCEDDRRCDLVDPEGQTCERYNPWFDPELGVETGTVHVVIDAPVSLAGLVIEATPVDPPDAVVEDLTFEPSQGARFDVPAGTTWDFAFHLAGLRDLELHDVVAPPVLETLLLGPYDMMPVDSDTFVALGVSTTWTHPDAFGVDATNQVMFLVVDGVWKSIRLGATALEVRNTGLVPPATGSEPLRPVIARSGAAVLATVDGAALVEPGGQILHLLASDAAAWTARFSGDGERVVVRAPADGVGPGPAYVYAADGTLLESLPSGQGESLSHDGTFLSRIEGQQAVIYDFVADTEIRHALDATLEGTKTHLHPDGTMTAVYGVYDWAGDDEGAATCQSPNPACVLRVLHDDGTFVTSDVAAREVAWSTDGSRLFVASGVSGWPDSSLAAGVKSVDPDDGVGAWVGTKLVEGGTVLRQGARVVAARSGGGIHLGDADANAVTVQGGTSSPDRAWSDGAIWWPAWYQLPVDGSPEAVALPDCGAWVGPDLSSCITTSATGLFVNGDWRLTGAVTPHPRALLTEGPMPCYPVLAAIGAACAR